MAEADRLDASYNDTVAWLVERGLGLDVPEPRANDNTQEALPIQRTA